MARHRVDSERAKWVSRWRSRGEGCELFARRQGLSPATLYRWAQQADEEATGEVPGFAEVRVVGAAVSAGLEVAHPSGCVVRVGGVVDEAQLVAVLRALGTC